MNLSSPILRTVAGRPVARKRIAALVAAALSGYAANAVADTAAGTVLQNQATAVYRDANANAYTAQSNLSTITVRQVYSAELAQDRSQTVAAGQTANFSHALRNTGNGPDTYTVTVADVGASSFSGLAVFVDANGNGQPDAGEIEVANGATVTLDAGEQVNLVVQGVIPGNAIEGDSFEARLTVTTSNGTVIDTGADADGTDGTNQDTAVVTGGAVLNIRKSSVHDPVAGTISYTVTVSNTGNRPASDVVVFDGIPAGTSLVPGSVQASGFGSGIDASDTGAIFAAALNESTLSVDLNADGDQLDGGDESPVGLDIDIDNDGARTGNDLPGVYGIDAVLPANTTVSLSYSVSYVADALGANATIDNVAHVSGDVDGVAGADVLLGSNQTRDLVAQDFAVLAEDNDGFTGDAPDGDDVEAIASAGAGSVVVFTHQVRNVGNGDDTYALRIDGSTFPAGTEFTFWDATGTVQLLDTDNDGSPDTGPMRQDEIVAVQVHARLPADVAATATAVSASLVATSAGAAAQGLTVEDATTLELGAITGAGADLANGLQDDDPAANQHAYADDGTPVTTESALPGETVSFALSVENDSAVPTAFDLSAGGSWNGASLGALPAGWSVVFRDGSGAAVSSTVAIPAGGQQALTAEVTIPQRADQSLADRPATDLGTAGTVVVDGNMDGDGDYAIFFRAFSRATGVSDVKLDAVDVNELTDIALTPSSSGQIQPGGSIDYTASLKNQGNVTDVFTLAGVNAGAAGGWGNSVLVDTDGDGLGDKPFGALVPGSDDVWYLNAGGTLVSQVAGGIAGAPTVELAAGEELPIDVRVFSPASAPNGQRDVMTLTASYNGGADSVSVTEQTTVVLGQLRLTKTNALDSDCDGQPDGALADPVFEVVDGDGGVEPGQCVVWQVIVTNEGDAAVKDVVVYDAAPAFTTYLADSMRSCDGNAGPTVQGTCDDAGSGDFNSGTAGAVSSFKFADAAADPNLAGHHASVDTQGNVTFRVGSDDSASTTADESPTAASGGAIASGASATVRFATRVD